MLTTCWAAKGGSGTTAVVASLAVLAALHQSVPMLVDLAGDVAAVLGHPDPTGPGLGDWLNSSADVGPEALPRLFTDLGRIDLLTCAPVCPSASAERIGVLMSWLKASDRPVFVDAGCRDSPLSHALIDGADRSLLVTRLCYLSVRRAIASPRAASGLVVLREPGRSLTERDLESALDVPIVARIDVTSAMARTLDAGLLQHRMPSYVRRALERAA